MTSILRIFYIEYVLALYALGVAYETGKGGPQDYVEAHKWYNLTGAADRTFNMSWYRMVSAPRNASRSKDDSRRHIESPSLSPRVA